MAKAADPPKNRRKDTHPRGGQLGVQETVAEADGIAEETRLRPMAQAGVLDRETVDGLAVMGDPWSFLILREALFGIQRFDEFRRNIGCAKSILANRLAQLVSAGVLSRKSAASGQYKPIYKLTRIGVDTFEVVIALIQWGDRWLAGGAGPPLIVTHQACGKRLRGKLHCDACGDPVTLAGIVPTSPAGSEQIYSKRMRRASNGNDYLRGRNCSGARTMRIIGNRWTLKILLEAFAGTRRFEDFRENIGIARNILTDRLNMLVEEQILARHRYQEAPAWYEYKLTPRGRELHAVCLLLQRWSNKWYGDRSGTGPVFIHKDCGRLLLPTYVCAGCGGEFSAFDVKHKDGPGAGWNDVT
jgi:DNA-binding HxlR family transcriptional regulator